jgi:fructokinase
MYLSAKVERPNVMFFDRVSPASISLAETYRARGALVVFEPSARGEPRLFAQAVRLAHILKFSDERMGRISQEWEIDGPELVVETLGEVGLRYRWTAPRSEQVDWRYLEAFAVGEVKDTAGSGDWCAAALIDRLGRGGAVGFLQASESEISGALRYGQAAAAWNCGFIGARGGMYVKEAKTFEVEIGRILGGERLRGVREESVVSETDALSHLCVPCQGSHFRI